MKIISDTILFSGLFAACLWDVKTKTIPVPILLVMAAAGGMIRIMEGSFLSFDTLLGLLPGIFLLIMSLAAREQILGTGDGLLVLAMGMLLSPEMLVCSGICAFFLAGIYGLFLITVKKRSGKTEIAFAPFLLCASVFIIAAGYAGG